MFATKSGNVRRNKLSDFVQVNRAGKIAMKLDEGDEIVDVQICSEGDDVLLTTAQGQCIRFAVPEVRVFKGRDSTGVRGISLAKDDRVIALAILRHFDASGEERAAYLRAAAAARRAESGEDANGNGAAEEALVEADEAVQPGYLAPDRQLAMTQSEQFVLTLSENGYGKRSSSFEFRTTGRGGKGIVAMAVNERNGRLVGSFPVGHDDQIMLITDAGQTIRVPVHDIRIVSRGSQGVIVFDTAEGERVVSVEHIEGDEDVGEGA
jgi:DNA gyrase subunit A